MRSKADLRSAYIKKKNANTSRLHSYYNLFLLLKQLFTRFFCDCKTSSNRYQRITF
nr:MAG TPA: hypothetical protein [Caudoviricetes sp.]